MADKTSRRLWTPPRSRLLALALVLGLGGSTPTSSHALLTELFVGGAVAMQVLGIVGEALPQVTALATSVEKLFKSGQDAAGTVGRIVDIFFPNRKKKADGKGETAADRDRSGEGSAPASKRPRTRRLELPDLAPRKDEDAVGPADEVPAAEGEETALQALLEAYQKREAVLAALEVADEEQRLALEFGLLELTKLYEQAVDDLIQELREAAQRGDQRRVFFFRKQVSELDEALRPGVDPVLELLLGRGEQFRSLYEGASEDEEREARVLAPLRSLLSRRSLR